MKINRESVQRGFIVFSVFTFSLSMAAGFMIPAASPARAEDDPQLSVTLTPEQTYALFGDNFQGTYYNSQLNRYSACTFEFVTLSSAWIPRTGQGPDHQNMYIGFTGINNQLGSSYHNPNECLVYKTSVFSGSSNTGESSTTSFNLQVPFNISIPSTFGYLQRIYYGQGGASSYPSLSTISECAVLGNGISYSFNANSTSSPRQYRLGWTPIKEVNDVSELDSLSKYQIGAFKIDIPNQSSSFDISSITLKCNQVEWNYNYDTQLWDFYIFLECPTLTGYTPPVVTTAPPVLTGTGATETIPTMQTIDLSNLESGVAAIIQNQYEIGALEGVIALQLNTIIGQLNMIYAEMVKEDINLPTLLHDADPYPSLGTNIMQDIDNSFTSYTFASVPAEDLGNGADGMNVLADRLGLYDGVWLTIGLFCTGFMIFCWFIFRGRGGV